MGWQVGYLFVKFRSPWGGSWNLTRATIEGRL